MKDECVDIELELSDSTIEIIEQHMKKSGLNFNDSFTEIIIMGLQACGEDV